jgi:hypothetical protein
MNVLGVICLPKVSLRNNTKIFSNSMVQEHMLITVLNDGLSRKLMS